MPHVLELLESHLELPHISSSDRLICGIAVDRVDHRRVEAVRQRVQCHSLVHVEGIGGAALSFDQRAFLIAETYNRA